MIASKFTRCIGIVICGTLSLIIFYYSIIGVIRTIKSYKNYYADIYEKSPRSKVHLDKIGSTNIKLVLPGKRLFLPGGCIYFEFEKGKGGDISNDIYAVIKNSKGTTVLDEKLKLVYTEVYGKNKNDCFDTVVALQEFDSGEPGPFDMLLIVKKPIVGLTEKEQYVYAEHITYGKWLIVKIFDLWLTSFAIFGFVLLIWVIFKLLYMKTTAKIVGTIVCVTCLLLLFVNVFLFIFQRKI